MADFKRHVTCSSTTGVFVGGAAFVCGVPPATSLVAAGLCGLAGMLPDVDSDSSRSFKTCMHIAAVLGAMLAIQGSRILRIDHDWGIFAASCVFFFILYVVSSMIQKLTVHRGMIHSIPAAVIAGQCVYLVSEGDTTARIAKALGLTAGFLSHLILDEVYSIDSTGKAFKIKKSFGTAVKMIDYKHKHITATFYAVALLLGALIANESVLFEEFGLRELAARRSQAEDEPRPTPLKDMLTALFKQPSKSSEPTAVSEPLETVSVDLRPTIQTDSRYAENETFRRRRKARQSETVETSETVVVLESAVPPPSLPLPDRPVLFRKYEANADAPPGFSGPPVDAASLPEGIRNARAIRDHAPAPIALQK